MARVRGWVMMLALGLVACGGQPRQQIASPAQNYTKAQPADPVSGVGYRDIRFWGDIASPILPEAATPFSAASRAIESDGGRIDLLALSGGGEDGAFGAGLLAGWTERGDRPVFTWVTGVSTGALIAPFAFLGPDHDAALKRLYTGVSTRDILTLRPAAVLTGASALGDSRPLAARIQREVTPELVEAIAQQARTRPRKLLIGTTNLDAQRPVVWDITAIAASGQPGRVDLIRRILLASASIPGLFPPVEIDVTLNGRRYKEMHVDGGTTHEVIAYPIAVNVPGVARMRRAAPEQTMWVVRNSYLGPEYAPVRTGFVDIASRSIATLIKYQGRGDIALLEDLARRDNYRFRLIAIPKEVPARSSEIFDPARMADLYALGHQMGAAGGPWQDHYVKRD